MTATTSERKKVILTDETNDKSFTETTDPFKWVTKAGNLFIWCLRGSAR
jgi:hypothetical protein